MSNSFNRTLQDTSDYSSFKNIKNKNELFTSQVLKDYETQKLTLQNLQTEYSPLKIIYDNTYKFLNYTIPPFTYNKDRYIKNNARNVTSTVQ